MPPILNIISLPHRLDRKQSYMEQCADQNIAYNVWEGIVHKTPCTGISRAHKQIVQKAKDEYWPYAIIAEDDICFSAPNAWKYFLFHIPKYFDLFCGVMYDGVTDENNRIITTKGMSGTNTLYVINRRFFDFFLMVDESKNLDRELGKFATLNKYILCNPMVCYQMDGVSDHFKRRMEYGPYLQDKKLYGQ